MDDYSAYADSAQARQMDRQARQNLDYWGNPVGTHESSFHTYDVAAAQARETEYRKGLAKRIGTAIAQMELICPPNPPETSATPQGARGIAMSQTTELAEVPPAETALQVFTTEKGLEPWLQQVRLKIDDFNKTLPELTTQKGRDRYASMAHQIAKSKTALEAVGKALSAKQKELPKKIDAERKRVWDTLEVWQKEVRRPLDDWQAAEDARIDGHKDSIQWLVNLAEGLGDLSAEQISQRVNDAEAFTIGQHLEEFEADAARAKDASLGKLRTSLDARRKHEVELAEIARFNVEKEERDRAEHEARIAREAAEKAQREANEQAEADRKAAAEREQQLINQAERQRLELQLQAQQAERLALQAKADQEAAERRAEQERIAAHERQAAAVEEARLAEIARANAAADEINRLAAIREADKEHKKTVCLAAQQAMVAGGIAEDVAKAVIILIHQRRIPAITIAY